MRKNRSLEEMEKSQYLTPREASVYLGVSVPTIYHWLKTNTFGDRLHKNSYNGFNILLNRDELDTLVSQKK